MSSVVIDVTGRCNLHCSHCYANHYRRFHPPKQSLLEIIRAIPPEINIVFMGGEPMIRRDIFELVYCSASTGHVTTIVTNATLITEKIAYKLIDSGINNIQCSLDGPTSAINDIVRGQGTFEFALDGILALDSAIKGNNTLSICITVNSINYRYVAQICELLSDRGIFASINLERTMAAGSAVKNNFLVPIDKEWMDACIQLCANWRRWPRLDKASFMGRPLFVRSLENRYSILLDRATYRCPSVLGELLGRVFPDGTIFTCGQRELLEQAANCGFLLNEGLPALQVLQDMRPPYFAYRYNINMLSKAMRSPSHPFCDNCIARSECSNCPVQNLLGYKVDPTLCIMALDLKETDSGDITSKYNPEVKTSVLHNTRIPNKVYWKLLRDGGMAIFVPSTHKSLQIPSYLASVWKQLCEGIPLKTISESNSSLEFAPGCGSMVDVLIEVLIRIGALYLE